VPRNISYAVPCGTRACAGPRRDVGCAAFDGVPDFPAADAGRVIGRTTGRSTTRIRTRDEPREARLPRDVNELPGVP
jgi:hypothetical protein